MKLSPFIIEKLKEAGITTLLNKNNESFRNTDFKCSKKQKLEFWKLLLKPYMLVKEMKEILNGFDNRNDTSIDSLYDYAQIGIAIDIYEKFQAKDSLFDVGLKYAFGKPVLNIIEKLLQTKFTQIGTMQYGNSSYNIYEEPKQGILVSLSVKEHDYMGPVVFIGDYTGIVVPGFKLAREIAIALNKNMTGIQIEWPFNRLGGFGVNDFNKPNQLNKKDIIFKLEFTKEPILKKFAK